ncbi:putative calcium-binding protein CML30 [Hibiscus syriacus]|uniref:Calcium-binding protein CML30 n=1 Tax=Hibiscus syriacus TaxID=106335 RepID=A0A6A2XGU0_HIBSY|nr:probable calcium-binding protein CML46 [Hibiscus syriacus]KAE8661336.1 putative calcium-binding protein CML30 [Hibiscus syriacus]
METSSVNSNQFPLLDMVLLFHGFSCYNTIKSFFSRYWSSSSPQPQKISEFSSTEDFSSGERLCRKEVENLMGNLGILCSHEREEEELNKSLGCEEISGLFEEEPSLEEVKETFDVFDVNRDGFIDAEELQRVLCVLGLKQGLKLENCIKMIQTFDEDGDGRIDFQEFVKLMENSFC